MNDTVNKRPRYFDGQYLQDVDFQTEQNYHIDRQRRFARLLTVSGIAEGLTCETSVDDGNSGGVNLQETSIEEIFFTVKKGTAIDAQGRQIVLLQDRTNIQLKDNSSGDKILYIKYSDMASSEDMQGSNETRVIEEPEIGFIDNIDNEKGTYIPLARVDIKDGKFEGLDFGVREYSGISLPTPGASPNGDNQTAVTLRSANSQEYTSLAELAGSLSIMGNVGIGSLPGIEQLRVQGDSAITGSLSVSQTTTLEGNVGIGGAPGSEQLRIQGDSAITGALSVANTTTLTGNVGVGGAPGNERLKVQGNSAIIGSLSVSQATTLGDKVGIGGPPGNEQLKVQGNTLIEGNLTTSGKYVVQDGQNGGNSRGIFMWQAQDSNWGIYMGQSGGKHSLSGGKATSGSGFSSHAIRLRTHSSKDCGLIYENSKEELNFSVRASDGHTYLRGNVGIGTHNPSIHLAIGDNDTGLKQIGDGELAVCSNSHQRITIKKNGKVGIITADPKSTLSIYGEAAIGKAYANEIKAPSNGLLVQGNVGIGTNSPQSKLDVHGSTKMSGSLSVGGYIMKIGNADNYLAIKTLNELPETRIAMLGGAWGDNIYFYWKFDSTVYGVAIRGKRMTQHDRDPRYI